MKKIVSILYCCVGLCLVACQPSKKTLPSESASIVISINELGDSVIRASSYFKSATVIPLETSDSCLLASPEKVIPYKNRLYLSDVQNQAGVFCFDMDGKLLKIIGSKGRGSQEHSSLDDFSIDEETGLLYLYNSGRNRILVFTIEGEYMKSIPVEDYFSKMEVFNRHIYLTRNKSGADSYDVEIKNLDGKTVGKFFPSLQNKIPSVPQFMKTSQDIYYYPNRSQDTVYSLTKNSPEIAFYADYGKYAVKRPEWEKMMDMTYVSSHPVWQTFLQNDYIGGFTSFFNFDKWIVFKFAYHLDNSWIVFYEKSTGKTHVANSFVDDVGLTNFSHMISQTDNQLICAAVNPDFEPNIKSVRTFWVEQHYISPGEAEKAASRLESLQSRLAEDSNPVVVIYDLK